MKYYEDNKYGSLDILIHERGTDANNICAFECKKEKISETDVVKIRALLGPEYRYTFGLTIEYVPRNVKLYFKNGRKIIEEKIEL